MRNRRNGRPKTHGSWTPESSAKAHAAKARMKLEGPANRGPEKVPAGTLLGVLQWHAAHGEVKRITVKQGGRANQIRVLGCRRDHGFDWLMARLRRKISIPRRIYAVGAGGGKNE